MKILTLDFETYFDKDYTLSKATTEAYIRDPRFEALCLGVRYPSGDMACYEPESIPVFLRSQDWANLGVLAHHSQFDGLILSHHYGVKPAMWFDTLAMARLQIGNGFSVALGSLAHHFNLEPKSVPYDLFKGKHWRDLDPATRQLVKDGCMHDVALTFEIFQRLIEGDE